MNRPEDIAALEVVAKLIYESFDGAEAHPWVEHGNSLRQNAARHNARSALEKAGYPLPGKPLAFRVIGRLGKSEWQDANERDETGTLLEITIAEAAKLDNPDEISIEIAYSGKTTSSPQVADGYAIVPIEPTDAMCDAAMASIRMEHEGGRTGMSFYPLHAYRAMLAAAPSPPQSAPKAAEPQVIPFATVQNVVRALVNLGCAVPESHEEQAARAIELTDWLCHEVLRAPDDEPLFTASMYGTAAVADKARDEWLAAKKCQCAACTSVQHASDCSVHNEPAYPNGPCDCGMTADQRKELEALEADCRNPETPLTFEDVADRIAATFTEVQWPRRRLSMTFTHDTCGDALFCRMCVVAAHEYFAADSGNGVVWAFVASNGVRVQITSHELLQWEKAQL